MTEQNEVKTPRSTSVRTWLFNPFHYVAGWQALLAGIVVILASTLLGAMSNTHFDGVLDVHTAYQMPIWVFIGEGLIDWLAMGVAVFCVGLAIAKTRFRALDVFGTQALARAPYLLTAVVRLLPGYERFANALVSSLSETMAKAADSGTPPSPREVVFPGGTGPLDLISFALVMIVVLVTLIWMIVLMYRAFAVSCNVRGGKAIASFIGAIVVAEVLSKVLIGVLISVMPVPTASSVDPSFDVSAAGREFVSLLAAGKYEEAAGFVDPDDPKVATVLDAAKLREAWEGLDDEMGPFREQLGARTGRQLQYEYAVVTCAFEKATVDVRVVYSPNGKVSGLWYEPSRGAPAPEQGAAQ